MNDAPLVSLTFTRLAPRVASDRVSQFLADMTTRRSVRHFSSEPIDLDLVRQAILTAAQAPSGANKQPWKFVLVTDPEVKHAIRIAAEREEEAFYDGRAGQEWLDDLMPLGTGPKKPFLEEAPALIVVMTEAHAEDASRHYYVKESVGIATGFLLAALHLAGLATLTHTPSPMGFLRELLGRPRHERPFLLIPVGYPVLGCQVPAITRKHLADVLVEVGESRVEKPTS